MAASENAMAAEIPSGSLRFILVLVALDMCAVGLVAPVLPRIIAELLGGTQAGAARYLGWFASMFALMQLFFAPVIGALSDRFGRRPVLLVSMFAIAFEYALVALAPTIAWLFVGRLLTGATSSNIATASAYVADVAPPAERAAKFGMVGAAFALGYMMGPALGGLLGQFDLRLPLWVACALCLFNGVYGLFFLAESRRGQRGPLNLAMANPLGVLRLYRASPELTRLAWVLLLYFLIIPIVWTVWAPYTTVRYGWSVGMIGISLTAVGLMGALVQALVVRRVVARWTEWGGAYIGLSAGAAGFALFGLAPVGAIFLLGLPLYGLMGLIGPGIQGLMSKQVSADEQGRLQGANTSLMALGSIVGPILFTQVFALSASAPASRMPAGTAFFLAAGMLAFALIVAVTTRKSGSVSSGGSAPRR